MRPGFVQSAGGLVRLEPGQRWFLDVPGEDTRSLFLVVVSLQPQGEVVLRPEDSIQKFVSDRAYSPEGTYDDPAIPKQVCPFAWVTDRQAKGSKGVYQEGDLLCNEAWDLWQRMRLLT